MAGEGCLNGVCARSQPVAILAGLMALLLLAVPGTQAVGIDNPRDSTPTTMYFHMDGRMDFPVNTQMPEKGFTMAQGGGIVTHSTGCLPAANPNVPPTLVRNTHHTYYAYSSSSYVEYDYEDNEGRPRYNKQPGISYDVALDGGVVPVFHWFLESKAMAADLPPPADPNDLPLVIPEVVLEVTIRQGDDVSIDHARLNEGPVIAHGASDPALLAAEWTPDHPHAAYLGPSRDGSPLYGVSFPLAYIMEAPHLLREEAFNVRIDLYVKEPLGVCTGPGHPESSTIMPDVLAPYLGPGALPRFTWNIMEPLRIETIHPVFVDEGIVIHTVASSPWGNYDIAEPDDPYMAHGEPSITIAGPSEPQDIELIKIEQRYHSHDHTRDPATFSWLWRSYDEGAADGAYDVTVRIGNDQETATAVATARFHLGGGVAEACRLDAAGEPDCFVDRQSELRGHVEAPVPVVLVLVALLGAVVLRRR